jgi:hypothetical protein
VNRLRVVVFSLLLVLFGAGQYIFAPSASALSVSVGIPEKYTEVAAGERLYFDIEIKYPENPARKDLRLEYTLKRGDVVVSQAKVLKAVETQSSFLDYIVVPDDAKSGGYTIEVQILDYDSLDANVSATFRVSKQADRVLIYFGIILGVIVLFGVIIIFEIARLRKVIR